MADMTGATATNLDLSHEEPMPAALGAPTLVPIDPPPPEAFDALRLMENAITSSTAIRPEDLTRGHSMGAMSSMIQPGAYVFDGITIPHTTNPYLDNPVNIDILPTPDHANPLEIPRVDPEVCRALQQAHNQIVQTNESLIGSIDSPAARNHLTHQTKQVQRNLERDLRMTATECWVQSMEQTYDPHGQIQTTWTVASNTRHMTLPGVGSIQNANINPEGTGGTGEITVARPNPEIAAARGNAEGPPIEAETYQQYQQPIQWNYQPQGGYVTVAIPTATTYAVTAGSLYAWGTAGGAGGTATTGAGGQGEYAGTYRYGAGSGYITGISTNGTGGAGGTSTGILGAGSGPYYMTQTVGTSYTIPSYTYTTPNITVTVNGQIVGGVPYPYGDFYSYEQAAKPDPVKSLRERVKRNLAMSSLRKRVGLMVAGTAAEQKARRTLRDMLSEDDWRRYCVNGFIIARGGDSGRVYQIFADRRRIVVFEKGKKIGTHCIHTDSKCPPTDHVINMKVLVELDEATFLKGGNYRAEGNSNNYEGLGEIAAGYLSVRNDEMNLVENFRSLKAANG